jgi:hypothetical protein
MCVFDAGEQLQLGHLNAVTQLQLINGGVGSTQRGGRQNSSRAVDNIGQLPPNLCELQWQYAHEGLGWGLQQLLALTRLQKLELLGKMLELEQQQQLPQLTSLVSLTKIDVCCSAVTAAACSALPIKALSITSDDATPAVLQQLCAFSGLTYLGISGKHLPATMQQLSATLVQLTALQHVSITGINTTAANRPARSTRSSSVAARTSSTGSDSCGAGSASVVRGVEGIAKLLRAVGCLPDLGSVCIAFPVMLLLAELRQLQEFKSSWLPGCTLAFMLTAGDVHCTKFV